MIQWLLQPLVLVLESPRPCRVGNRQPALLRLPVAEGRITGPTLAAQVGDFYASLMLG